MEEETRETNDDKRWKFQRRFVAFCYFIFPILIILIFLYFDSLSKIFYSTENKGIGSLYRLLWCFFGSMWGLSAIAYYWRDVSESPFPSYLTVYPFTLLVISLLVFSILHLFEKTSGYLFYYFSFGLCAFLGFQIDQFYNIIKDILKKTKSDIEKNITKNSR